MSTFSSVSAIYLTAIRYAFNMGQVWEKYGAAMGQVAYRLVSSKEIIAVNQTIRSETAIIAISKVGVIFFELKE